MVKQASVASCCVLLQGVDLPPPPIAAPESLPDAQKLRVDLPIYGGLDHTYAMPPNRAGEAVRRRSVVTKRQTMTTATVTSPPLLPAPSTSACSSQPLPPVGIHCVGVTSSASAGVTSSASAAAVFVSVEQVPLVRSIGS